MELINVMVPPIFIRDAGDIVDRWAISKLKAERIKGDENIREYKAFEEGRVYLKEKYPKFEWEIIFKLLLDVHSFLWQFESGTKSGKEQLPDQIYILNKKNESILAKIGIIGIEIKNYNHIRIAIKNYINKTLGEGFMEIKKDHLSA
jgi:hypothetical protein